ncbi:MAG: hypothetical protein AAF846_06660 [Chloroflexota bacterium]
MLQQFLSKESSFKLGQWQIELSAILKQMLLYAIIVTIIWWIVGLTRPIGIDDTRWGDQRFIFLAGLDGVINPYSVEGYINPPWAYVFLLPFSLLPVEVAVLMQGILYHCVLMAIGFMYAPSKSTDRDKLFIGLALLTSPFFADIAVELNIDWIPAIGLLVPPSLSPIFILAKPQNALGYYLSLEWKPLMRAILVGSAVIVMSFFIWGFDWINELLLSIQNTPPGGLNFNAAPMSHIGILPSITIGLILAIGLIYNIHFSTTSKSAQRQQRDLTLYAVVCGFFLLPYLAGYSLALIYALLVAKVPRIMLALNIILWIGIIILLIPFFIS